MTPVDDFAELRALLDALCEETITPEQLKRLEQLVLNHPEAEAYYVQYMSMYADLGRHFGGLPEKVGQSLRHRLGVAPPETAPEQLAPQDARPGPSLKRRLTKYVLLGMGVSGLAAAAAVLFMVAQGSRNEEEALDSSVAVLVQAPGAEWEGQGPFPRAGAALPARLLRLKSGFAQIEFYSGAMVILEGPAELQLISRMEAFCARGKLRARVPPQAQGFTIRSPKLDLVDRGTEFGLVVDDQTEVHVFEGKVELHDPHRKPTKAPHKELITGESVRLEAPGQIQAIKSNPEGFLTAKDLAARSQAELKQRQKDWLAASQALRQDPSLLVYYPFQTKQPWNRILLDEAAARKEPRDAAIVGCSWVTGRWPGKQALEFKGVSDRVRFHVPGEFASITLMAWVRIDALPNRNNSLMMSDGWDEGELHWQIGKTGTIILGVQGSPKGKGGQYHATEFIKPNRFRSWLHLAVVYDRDHGLVTHYADGQPVAQAPVLFDIPLRIGDAQLGNWDLASHRNNTPVRFFTGCMDEFMLFARALSEHEVEELYQKGLPL